MFVRGKKISVTEKNDLSSLSKFIIPISDMYRVAGQNFQTEFTARKGISGKKKTSLLKQQILRVAERIVQVIEFVYSVHLKRSKIEVHFFLFFNG